MNAAAKGREEPLRSALLTSVHAPRQAYFHRRHTSNPRPDLLLHIITACALPTSLHATVARSQPTLRSMQRWTPSNSLPTHLSQRQHAHPRWWTALVRRRRIAAVF